MNSSREREKGKENSFFRLVVVRSTWRRLVTTIFSQMKSLTNEQTCSSSYFTCDRSFDRTFSDWNLIKMNQCCYPSYPFSIRNELITCSTRLFFLFLFVLLIRRTSWEWRRSMESLVKHKEKRWSRTVRTDLTKRETCFLYDMLKTT